MVGLRILQEWKKYDPCCMEVDKDNFQIILIDDVVRQFCHSTNEMYWHNACCTHTHLTIRRYVVELSDRCQEMVINAFKTIFHDVVISIDKNQFIRSNETCISWILSSVCRKSHSNALVGFEYSWINSRLLLLLLFYNST